VSVRFIAVFPHRGLSINAWRIESGASHQLPALRVLRLLFMTEGSGTIGTGELRRWSTVRLAPGEGAQLRSASRLELLELSVRSVRDLKPHLQSQDEGRA
jgi:hypothetical protein